MPSTTTGREQQFDHTSGATDAVWVHTDPYEQRPTFDPLTADTQCDVCIVGAGIAGLSVAQELVARGGRRVVLVEARTVLSGETGRTSGHLSTMLGSRYTALQRTFGHNGAKRAAASHGWAVGRVGEVATELGILEESDYRRLPAYLVSQYAAGVDAATDAKRAADLESLKTEAALAQQLGLDAAFDPALTVGGWGGASDKTADNAPDQRGGVVFRDQAAFHPTKYLRGVLAWLVQQPNFACYTHTRVVSVEDTKGKDDGDGDHKARVTTETGHTISCTEAAVETTNAPLQKLAVITQMRSQRTYCVALRVPRGAVEDCLLYDSADPYTYVRLIPCDDEHDYLVVGGGDHEVGHEPADDARFEALAAWARARFPSVAARPASDDDCDYSWSGQVLEPVDGLAYIGRNPGQQHVYIVTGDSGNGLTHGVLAGRLVADALDGRQNPWAALYAPTRVASVLASAGSLVAHAVESNAEYKRFLTSDLPDIEDLQPDQGGVLNPTLGGTPVAVYRDPETGEVTQMSALCPHLKGVVCWNAVEKTFDCPVHGSRFSDRGVCIMGPAKGDLALVDTKEARG